MKEKDIIKRGELESINDELFDELDPEAESSIGGAGRTISSTADVTSSPNGYDYVTDVDIDFSFPEA